MEGHAGDIDEHGYDVPSGESPAPPVAPPSASEGILIQLPLVTVKQQSRGTRRPQWRGERKAVLVRLPVDLADELARSADGAGQSVSECAAQLLASALRGPGQA